MPVALPPLSPYRSTPCPPQPPIQTTTVGSYPIPDWLQALPSEQSLVDATRVVFDTQRQAGIDLPTDGELYRFDINHPDTNGHDRVLRPAHGRHPARNLAAAKPRSSPPNKAWASGPSPQP